MPANVQAEQCKERGNKAFGKGMISAAIEAYSEAICFDPDEAVYYTNRAMCHRKRQEWDAVVADCQTALLLEETSIKGHYLLGLALDGQGDHQGAAHHLQRALDLCKERTVSYKEDIRRAFYVARKRHWAAQHPNTDAQIQITEALVARLLKEHLEGEHHQASGSNSDYSEGMGAAACMTAAMEALRARGGPGSVPDYLCCKITMEPMLEPVVTPDGISYERSVLLEHLNKVGRFDPVTRRDLDPQQLVPNLALKEAVSTFLDENPWAYEGPL